MILCRRWSAVVLALTVWDLSSPQTARAIPPATRVTQLVVDTWTTNDGLPQDRVQAIAQTRDGLLWVGTEAGLARFDGHRLAVFAPSAFPGLRNESITSLRGSSDGALWIGTLSRACSIGSSAHSRAGALAARRRAQRRVGHRGGHTRERIPLGTAGGLARVTDGAVKVLAPEAGQVFALAPTAEGDWWLGGRRGLLRWSAGALRRFGEADGYRWGQVNSVGLAPDGTL